MKKLLKWGLIVFVAIIVVSVIASSQDGGSTPTTQAQVQTVVTSPAITESPSTEPPTTITTKAPEWVEVSKLSGKGAKKGPVFELTGGSARLRYSLKGDIVILSVYVTPEGENVQTTGGFPEIMVSEAEEGESTLVRDPGRYYLDVNAQGDWFVIVEEER